MVMAFHFSIHTSSLVTEAMDVSVGDFDVCFYLYWNTWVSSPVSVLSKNMGSFNSLVKGFEQFPFLTSCLTLRLSFCIFLV